MKEKTIVFLLFLFLAMPLQSFAHRVNIFAWTEGQTVKVKASFSKSSPARDSNISVMDGISQKVLLTGKTNEAGAFEFTLPTTSSKTGLIIRVNAGEGHQNEWTISAKECAAQLGVAHKETVKVSQQKIKQEPKENLLSKANQTQCLTPEAFKKIVDQSVNESLESKLGPIREKLASQVHLGPRVIDILGGLGWIFGIIGVAMAIRAKMKK